MADLTNAALPPNVKDMLGQRFTRLLVIEALGSDKFQHRIWRCLCDCGKEVIADTAKLRGNKTRSCGCWRDDTRSTHRMSNTAEHDIWMGIRDRCTKPAHRQFHSYGGREINPVTISDEWKSDFMAFFSDMGPRPSIKHSIDRIDGNKGYCKENCRWATSTQQARNKRTNRPITFGGETLLMIEWAERYGLKKHTVTNRLRSGWSMARVISTPETKKADPLA